MLEKRKITTRHSVAKIHNLGLLSAPERYSLNERFSLLFTTLSHSTIPRIGVGWHLFLSIHEFQDLFLEFWLLVAVDPNPDLPIGIIPNLVNPDL